jgi:hypothetical protein
MLSPHTPVHDQTANLPYHASCSRFACRVLLTVTLANALAGMLSIALTPDTSNWADPAKLTAHAIWTATGYASPVTVAGWLAVYFILGLRGDLSVRIGCVVGIVHSAAWLLAPSWS